MRNEMTRAEKMACHWVEAVLLIWTSDDRGMLTELQKP